MLNDREFKVLELINNFKGINQREISSKSSISLGSVNLIINNLISAKYIDTTKEGKITYYFLTNLGLDYLEKSLLEISNKKLTIHNNNYKEIKQAVILGAGEKKEFGKPVGFLSIEETNIINRILSILKDNGIDDILIVSGYESEYYEELAKTQNITVIKNDKYKWTGTMYSLSLAKDFIKDDFILIENDMIFEERAITDILKVKSRDCMLITSETGSGDEAFVEIREDYVYKMSKDIHMFNKIDGEMVGITKISYEVFQRMLEDYKRNINPYLNYEYSLLDVGRNLKIGYLKIDDLVWYEIDNMSHYKKVVDRTYSLIKRKELEVKVNTIKSYLTEALDIDTDSIGEIVPAGGMTNKNYKVYIDNKAYVLRIPGNGTQEMINRINEKTNAALASSIGLDTNIIYMNEETGIKISEFINNAETLNSFSSKREENMRLVVGLLRQLHTSDIVMNNVFDPFELMHNYEILAKEAQGKFYKNYEKVKEQVLNIKYVFDDLKITLKPCHNDTLPENFVKSSPDKMYLIDWEYSGLNDPMWDIAAHCLESGFSEDEEELFLKLYFNDDIDPIYKKRILLNKICQDFLWSIWTILKEAKGDDFGTYGQDRFNRAIENLNKALLS